MSDSELTNTGKIEKLRTELRAKRSELLAILEEKDDLKRKVRPKIIYDYELLFGKLEDELHERREIAQIYEAEMTKLIAKIKRGEIISMSVVQSINLRITEQIRIIQSEPKESSYIFFEDEYEGIIPEENNYSKSEIHSIFRALVKSLHPDSSNHSLFESHWDSVIEAYKEKDINKLKVYQNLILKEEIETEYSDMSISNLEKELIQTQRCIDFEKRKIKRILAEEPYSILESLKNNEWIKSREELIRSKIFETNKLISMLHNSLTDLTEGKITDIQEDSEKQFQEDFIDNTYLKY